MKVHFIAIGGSAMHNLAIALHKKGYQVGGSDDEIFDPARKRLLQYGLLPGRTGWFPEKLDNTIDAVILGMHARADNPELEKARQLGLNIFSYPEYLYEQSKEKTRIVIGGSHGKTTITAMVLHALHVSGVRTDYMVGAQLEGFEVMVQLSEDAPYMVIEGDEYLSSPIDPRPKFHLYKPHIALLSGIAWDHINVFPSFEMYVDQFRRFLHCIEEDGKLIYYKGDSLVKALCEEEAPESICKFPYDLPEYALEQGKTKILYRHRKYPVQVFGRHNLLNINGARMVCLQLGLTSEMFYQAMGSFKGASRRLEKIFQSNTMTVFRDFAHAPSKISASTQAVKEFFPDKHLIACIELHTFSSLNREFLDQYKGTLDAADEAFIFYDPHALMLKKLPDLDPAYIPDAFGNKEIRVFTDTLSLKNAIAARAFKQDTCLLFMSSGNFGGLDFSEFFTSDEQ